MQQVVCPGCGAPVQFKSSASVLAVCEFCKSTLLKDAQSVSNLGKMSDVLEDYSPLQIGSAGRFAQSSFALIGRIQLKYSAGFWNEWYALFDDGRTGWLSDASGQFAMTFLTIPPTTLPLFDKLSPGCLFNFTGNRYVASDVRIARCTGGQGELPFKVGDGWEARVADFRAADRFLSLDYSDTSVRVYLGQAVDLTQLQPQLLRDVEQITDTAGRFRGKVSALGCPSCGAPVCCVPGVTIHFVCPNCHAEVDTRGATAAVLAAGTAAEAVHFTLELGAQATINGASYSVLGAMRRAEVGDASMWNEYLLYAAGRKFMWMVETDEGWFRSEVLDRWPIWDGAGQPTIDDRRFVQRSAYAARVVAAIGSFNWRVSVGDVVGVTEFTNGVARIAAERTAEELTWSRSMPVALDQLRAWFGNAVRAAEQPHPLYVDTARKVLIALLIVNAIPLLFSASSCLTVLLFSAVAIYVPAYFLDRLDAKGQ